LVQHTTALLDTPCATRQATYDLRRFKHKGLILKAPHIHRYQLTSLGRRVAVLFYQDLRASPGSRLDLARSATTRPPQATQPSGHELATA
jgi:hypothetical protein